jgi:PAS domain S-box-containing protein
MTSVVIPALWLMAGLCVHAGFSHLLIGTRRPRGRTHILFGIQCLLAAMGAWGVAARHGAATLDDYVFYSRFANLFVQSFFVLMPWVIAAYTGARPKWPAAALSAGYTVTLLAEIALPYGLLFAERPELRSLELPWGDVVSVHAGPSTAFLDVFWTLHALLFLFIGWACWRQYRNGQRRAACVLALSMVPFALSLAINILVSFGIVRLVFIGAFGFVAMVLLMSWSLSRELQLRQAQNQAVLDNVPAVIWIKDLAGRYLFVNKYYERVFGKRLEDIAGKTDYELLSKEIADLRVESDRQVLVSGNRMHIEERIAFDQDQRILLALKFPLREANGRPYALCSISTDITDSKRTSDAMRALAQSASAEDGMTFFHDCVQQLARTYRAEHGFILLRAQSGETMTTLASWPQKQGAFDGVSMQGSLCRELAKLGGVYVERDAQQRFPDESWLAALQASGLCVASLVSADQRVTGLIGVTTQGSLELFPGATELLSVFARRVSVELERIEALDALRTLAAQLEQRVSERTRELEAFSYSVSHDLRTPLRAIDGFTSLVLESLDRPEDAPSREHLTRVRGTVRRMETLIDDLLQLAKVARHELSKETIDLSALVEQSVARLREQDDSRKVEVIVAPGMSAYGDPRLIAVVIDNLVGNAWKYTSQVARARIEAGTTDIGGTRAYFVRDNGAGFDPAHADRLFQAFQRLHDPRVFAGTGVGLAIVARIVERHNGKVWGESAPGAGATFYFTLPQA